MKISVDDQELFQITEIQKRIICNDIPKTEFYEDMKRRISYVVSHKAEQCFKRLKEEWIPKLESRTDSIPTNPEALANLIFSQPDYQCRATRDMQPEKE